MPTLKEYNLKLARLKSTRKLTRTMKMVSANKLRKAQEARANARAFEGRLNTIVDLLMSESDGDPQPETSPRRHVRRALMVVVTSDKGLCGGFNNNLNKHVLQWLAEHSGRYESVEMSFCGRRGFQFFQNRATVRQHYEGVTHRPSLADARRIGADLRASFLRGRFDEIHLAYNAPQGALSQKPAIVPLLPMIPAADRKAERLAGGANWLFEPGQGKLLALLLPVLINLKVFVALLDNAVGEHGARMAAMDNATTNAAKLIDELTLRRNRARQTAITTELIEIVAGAEALK